jgi:drug/metabolite transporter (DMT)-like permease
MNSAAQKSNVRTWMQLLVASIAWGATWVAGRIAVSELSPLATASWRFLLAAMVLGAILIRTEGWPRWDKRTWIGLTAMGVTGIFLYNLCFLYGLKHIEAGRGALVVALTPAVIALADWLIYKAPMTPRRLLGVVIALAGSLLVVTRGDVHLLSSGAVGVGEVLILGCVVLWAIYTFIGRRVNQTISPLASIFGASVTGWLMLTAAAVFDGSLFAFDALTTEGIASVAFLGVFGTALGFTWYAAGVRDIGPTQAGMFINLVPVFGVLLGALMLGERLSLATYIGGLIVIAGVLILNWPARVKPA